MSEKQAKLGRFGVFIFATALVALSLSGQQSSHTRTSLVTDWSSRHVVFSTPTTAAKLAEVSQDPRYQQQWIRRNMHPAPPTDGEATNGAAENAGANDAEETAAASLGGPGAGWGTGGSLGDRKPKGALKGDWTTSLGPAASVGADEYPAKFSLIAPRQAAPTISWSSVRALLELPQVQALRRREHSRAYRRMARPRR